MNGPEPRPVADLGFARVDLDRAARTGDPQVVELLRTLHEAHPGRAVLATRLSSAALAEVRAALPGASVDDMAACATLGPLPAPEGRVVVVSAGTSDAPVAAEAAVTAAVHGAGVHVVQDVGVAGLHRLLAVRDQLEDADCLVVVAGMEGALPSVVGGVVSAPIIAVPTSIGYGTALSGFTALFAMLTSCASGVAVVNIDSGFGAAMAAHRILSRRPPSAPATVPGAR
jgi:NCAIR mutase (PurE)-related protein